MESLWGLGAAGFAFLTGFTILGPSIKGRLGGFFACAIIAIALLTQAPHEQASWAGRLAGEGLAGGLALALLARVANAINRGADAWKIWKSRKTAPEQTSEDREITGLNFPLHLQYRDAKGAVTNRVITLHKVRGVKDVDGMRVIALIGYCHTRRAERTFRSDRVLEIADGGTGEIITNFASWLESHGPMVMQAPHVRTR